MSIKKFKLNINSLLRSSRNGSQLPFVSYINLNNKLYWKRNTKGQLIETEKFLILLVRLLKIMVLKTFLEGNLISSKFTSEHKQSWPNVKDVISNHCSYQHAINCKQTQRYSQLPTCSLKARIGFYEVWLPWKVIDCL